MMLRREDLKLDYSWANELEPHLFNGELTRRKFDRGNGNQVLFLINLYASQNPGFTLEEGLVIEDLLSNQLPLEAKSEISVFTWLREFRATNV
ncbi:MAG: hypothetical protein H7Y31_08465 [Chitinophagaceae bacterium]|nr:hypothetical protein [Chitinophagaceae bacterium]